MRVNVRIGPGERWVGSVTEKACAVSRGPSTANRNARTEKAGLLHQLNHESGGRRVSAKWRMTGLHGLSSSSRATLCSSEPRVSPVRGATGEPFRLGPIPKQERTEAKPGSTRCPNQRGAFALVGPSTRRHGVSRQQHTSSYVSHQRVRVRSALLIAFGFEPRCPRSRLRARRLSPGSLCRGFVNGVRSE